MAQLLPTTNVTAIGNSNTTSTTPSTQPYSQPTPLTTDPSLIIRRVELGDYSKGHCRLLGQLTQIGDITQERYEQRLKQILAASDSYHLLVIEDTKTHTIIGSATLLIEWKLIRGCASAGHVEDVVVDDRYRGKKLGHLIVLALHEIARYYGCYKVLLDCSESNMGFYAKIGYRESEKHMRCDL